jgi:hypothetical protein
VNVALRRAHERLVVFDLRTGKQVAEGKPLAGELLLGSNAPFAAPGQ